jgi:hypothetical protein
MTSPDLEAGLNDVIPAKPGIHEFSPRLSSLTLLSQFGCELSGTWVNVFAGYGSVVAP